MVPPGFRRLPRTAALLLLLVSAPALAEGTSAAPARPPPGKLKVMVGTIGDAGTPEGTGHLVADTVVARINGLHTYQVISGKEITAMLSVERQRELLGCSDEGSSCMMEISEALATDLLVSGQVTRLETVYRVTLTLTQVKKGKVLSRDTFECPLSREALVSASANSTDVLFAALDAPGVRTQRTVGLTLLGVGGAALVAGIATTAVTATRYQALQALTQPTFDAEFATRSAQIRQTALASDLLFGGAVVAGGVGTWLLLSSGRTEQALAFAPMLSSSGLAAVVAGRF